MGARRRGVLLACVLGMLAPAGCATVGQLTNAQEGACSAAFSDALADILRSQGEVPADATELAGKTLQVLASTRLGPRPFRIAAPSGSDYGFFIEPARDGCVLRLFARQRGFTRYTNNLTWIESRPLSGCQCAQ